MSIFGRKFTTESLRYKVRDRLPPEYSVIYDATGVGVKVDGSLVAYVELSENGKEATIAFSVTIWPAFAAELALLFNEILPTYVDAEVGFTAQEFEDIREAH